MTVVSNPYLKQILAALAEELVPLFPTPDAIPPEILESITLLMARMAEIEYDLEHIRQEVANHAAARPPR
jgi:hypothetical protein